MGCVPWLSVFKVWRRRLKAVARARKMRVLPVSPLILFFLVSDGVPYPTYVGGMCVHRVIDSVGVGCVPYPTYAGDMCAHRVIDSLGVGWSTSTDLRQADVVGRISEA